MSCGAGAAPGCSARTAPAERPAAVHSLHPGAPSAQRYRAAPRRSAPAPRVDRDRGRLARRAARRGGAAPRGLRRPARARRRGAALPYDRPPLSKEFLAGDWEPEQIRARRPGVDGSRSSCGSARARLSRSRAQRVSRSRTATRSRYDGLVIATGASRGGCRARRRSPASRLRTLDDALALRAALERGPRVVVVGAGFIGAEVAATCRQRGLEVTLLEALPAPLARGLGPALGALCAACTATTASTCARRGCRRLEGAPRRARAARRRHVFAADVVVVGVGAARDRWLAVGARARRRRGVRRDVRAAAPGVVAAGDVARWPTCVKTSRAPRALDERHRAGRRRGGSPARRTRAPCPSRRCRSSGRISTT